MISKEEEEKSVPRWNTIRSLEIALKIDFLSFIEDAAAAHATESDFYVLEAETKLANIEDCIKRYRERRPQRFEEE